MKDIIYKNADAVTLDVDNKTRRIKNAFNKVGVLDSDKDIIDGGAYNKTIAERGPSGKNLIWHLTDHMPYTSNAIAKFSELSVDHATGYLVGVTNVPNTTLGNDILEMYATGNINQHSIGFAVEKRDVYNEDDYSKRYTIIKELKLYEGSTVLWGANEFTPNISVGKGLVENVQDAVEKYLQEIDRLANALKNGKFSDQTFELIDYRFKQLKTQAKNIFDTINSKATEADKSASLQPDNDDQVKLNQQLLILKTQLTTL